MDELKLNEEEIKEGAPFAALSYVFFLWILTFIFKKENRFAHFHAKQGIVIFIAEIVCSVLALLPLIGKLFYVLGLLIFLILSLTGRLVRIPVISNIADRFII